MRGGTIEWMPICRGCVKQDEALLKLGPLPHPCVRCGEVTTTAVREVRNG